MSQSVSVIVPTFNRCAGLRRLLAALADEVAAGARFEVIVVVDGSTDGTSAMLRSLHTPYPLRTFEQANAGPAAARNRAVSEASGDLVLFLDDDVLPAPGIVGAHVRHHSDSKALVVIGPMLPPRGTRLKPWLAWEAATLRKQYDAMLAGLYAPTPRQFYTANASAPRRLVIEAGGFDERYTRAEDVELAYRMQLHGARFVFDPGAAVVHTPERSLANWRRVGYDYGRFDVLMTRDGIPGPPLAIAVREWPRRHPLARALARLCVGHRARLGALRFLFPLALRAGEAVGWQRPGQLACAAVFNVEYWQGVADATGAGAAIWDRFEALSRQRTAAGPATNARPAGDPIGGRP